MAAYSRPASLEDLKTLIRALNEKGADYLKQYAETIDLDGIPIRTVNLEGLLRTKQTMREKDVVDRIVLERALEAYRRQAPSRRD